MNPEILEEILSCPNLPSLPAVALRVIELTERKDVSMAELATTIQNDQGLTAKILRTVNSSFYGLRTKCASINKALVMLGLGPVKTLALGFSLVDSLKVEGDSRFDHVGYWRLGLYTAVAGKLIAHEAGKPFEEEAFLGGLLQDIGVMALYKALGDRYLQVFEMAGGDHRKLVKFELDHLELQHPDIGAMLAKRWKFPDELVLPVKYHERPSAAPAAHMDLVRAVALGNLAHDAVSGDETGAKMRSLYAKAQEWFGLDSGTVEKLLKRIVESAREMASLFKVDTGPYQNPDEVIAAAERRLVELAKQQPGEGSASLDSLVRDSDQTDPITGALRRAGFDPLVREAFDRTRGAGEPLTIAQVAVDQFAALNTSGASDSADEALISTATLLRKHFEPMGGTVCRWAEDVFAVVLPGLGAVETAKVCGQLRDDLRRGLTVRVGSADPAPVTASIGTATLDPATAHAYQRPEQLVAAATRAVAAAKSAGGNALRAFAPKAAAAA